MPPAKRKWSESADVDRELRPKDLPKKKGREESSGTISYDDFIKGGIPDALLEGLGFSEDGQSPTEEHSEDEEPVELIPEDKAVIANSVASLMLNQLSALAANQGGLPSGMTPQEYVNLLTAQKITKNNLTSGANLTKSSSLPRASNPPASGQAAPLSAEALAAVASEAAKAVVLGNKPAADAVVHNAGNRAKGSFESKTITKGSIVYRKLPTGEVIASLANEADATRPGETASQVKQSSPLARRPGNVQNVKPQQIAKPHLPASKPHLPASKPHLPGSQSQSSQLQYRDNPTLNVPMKVSGAKSCLFTEFNLDRAIECTVRATQTMRAILMNIRLELRRFDPKAEGIEQMHKRQEISERLMKAFSMFKRAVESLDMNVVVGKQALNPLSSKPMENKLAINTTTKNPAAVLAMAGMESKSVVNTSPKRSRRLSQNRKDVIELSDSDGTQDDEDEFLAGIANKDPVVEKKSRDQRAADREAQRNARLEAEAKKQSPAGSTNGDRETVEKSSEQNEVIVERQKEENSVKSIELKTDEENESTG